MKETFYLLVDDDSIVNNMHSMLFQMLQIERNVFIFDNAREALDFMLYTMDRSENDYIVFLDINMPTMNGWEFLNELEFEDKKATQKVKVVMVTSSIDIKDKEKAKTYPFVVDYISKPLKKEQVKELQSKFVKGNTTN